MFARNLLIVLALSAPSVQAAEIFRWVDAGGRVHYSDNRHDAERFNGTSFDPRISDSSAEQRQEAAARAARERSQLMAIERQRAADQSQAQAQALQAARALARPVQPGGELVRQIALQPGASCAARISAYTRSQECFARFRVGRGERPAGAYAACGNELPDPSPDCGQRV